MKIKTLILTLCFTCIAEVCAFAQNDSIQIQGGKEITIRKNRYNPRKATLLSAAFPGLGQLYTRSYWKMPIIYAGAGIIGYLLIDNSQKYVFWRDRYITQRTAIENGFPPPIINENRDAPFEVETLKLAKDTYRRYRDLNVILAGLLYVLNIADANVTAHLKSFDLTEDLSMTIEPDLFATQGAQLGTGISLRFTLK